MRASVHFLISLCCVIPITATNLDAQIHLELNKRPLDVRMDQVVMNEGFGNPGVYLILKDHNGYMWFATESSLHKYDGYTYKTYWANTGDSAGFVGNLPTCLYEDSDNLIWFGTQEGLNCLDPLSNVFTHYYLDRTDLTKQNNNNVVFHIAEDHNGLFWLITRGNVYTLDKVTGEIKEYIFPSLIYQNAFYESWLPARFLEDSESGIWIPTNNGLFKYLRDKDEFTAFYYDSVNQEIVGPKTIWTVTEDTEGNIWYATIGDGLHRIIDKETGESEKFQFKVDPAFRDKFDSTTHMAIGPDSCLWVTGWGWFAKIDYKANEQVTYHFHNISYRNDGLFYVNHDTEGNIWFFNDIRGILYRFNPETQVLSDYWIWANSSMGTDCIQDEFGAFWVGSAYGYAFRFDPYNSQYWFKEWREIFPPDFGSRYNRMVEDRNGTKWVVANGILHLENAGDFDNMQLVPFEFPDNHNEALYMMIDPDKFLWFVHHDNLLRKYDPDSGTSILYDMLKLSRGTNQDDLDFTKTHKIMMDKSGRIWWIFENSNDLAYFDPTTKEVTTVKILEPGNEIGMLYWDIMADKSGNIWVSSFDGICRLDPETFETRWYRGDIGSDGGLRDKYIKNIEEDPFGNIWCLSTHSGIYKYKKETDEFVPFLPIQSDFNYYTDILITADSLVWVSSYGRLLLYDLRTNNMKIVRLETKYDYATLSQTASGNIFMFNRGLYVFPNDFKYYKIEPKVLISGLIINESDYKEFLPEPIEVSNLRNIELKHNENFLRFEYVGLSFIDQDLNSYRYHMQGVNLDTIDAGTRTYADYFDLKPGKYTFWVTACNMDGVWNPTGTSMDIRIFPPWYGSVQAYASYGFLLLVSIFGLIRWRTRRLRHETEKLERQVKERTKTIEQQNEELEQQKEELQITLENLKETQNQLIQSEKLAALGGLVAGVAHEINTPVGISVTAASALTEETRVMADKYKTNKISRNEFKDYLNTTNQSAKLILANMERTATMVQSFKQVSVDQSSEQKRKFKLKEYCEDVIRSLYPKIKQKKIDIQLELDSELEMNSYPGDFSQILTNLVLNSFIHGFADRDSGEIRISARENGNDLEFLYSDNGKGIAKKDLDMIFNPFFTTNKKLGTGLGLHIVYNLVSQKLNGKIDCESKPGAGVQFKITVPKH